MTSSNMTEYLATCPTKRKYRRSRFTKYMLSAPAMIASTKNSKTRTMITAQAEECPWIGR
jgi:hypothetical protein